MLIRVLVRVWEDEYMIILCMSEVMEFRFSFGRILAWKDGFLKDRFNLLFELSENKMTIVAEMKHLCWSEDGEVWNLRCYGLGRRTN